MDNCVKPIFLALLLFVSVFVNAQIKHKSQIADHSYRSSSGVPVVALPELSDQKVHQAKESSLSTKKMQFAIMRELGIDVLENSLETQIATGTVWRVAIVSPGAKSIYAEFSEFELPEGGELSLYNPSLSHVIGAFTSDNNKFSKTFSVLPIVGDTLVVEYFQPNNKQGAPILVLGRIGHDFLGITSVLGGSKDGNFGRSGNCNIDINCFDGNLWARDKRSVARIIANGNLCTGSLVNNTKQDAQPLFYTANHCINSQEIADNMIAVFNYESPDCNGLDGSVEQAISGGIMRATTAALDMALVELSETPLPSFQPYYAGWDRLDAPSLQTIGIHHPQGDVKKISKDFDPPLSGTYLPYKEDAHWHIEGWDLGTTEGGSSGSPLFNQDHRVIGALTGGEAYCGYSFNDYYGKLASAWESFPDAANQLKAWLDPLNTGVTSLNGYDPYFGNNKPVAQFTSSHTKVLLGGKVDFTDLSLGNVTEWRWHFSGGSPGSSTEQHPKEITYTYPGKFMVHLVAINSYGDDEILASEYIEVGEDCGEFSNMASDEEPYLYSFGNDTWGYWTGHNQYGYTEFAEKFTNPAGNFLHGLKIFAGATFSSTPTSSVIIKVYKSGAIPGNLIYTQSELISNFSFGDTTVVTFDPAIALDGAFYVGYQISYNNADTFSVAHSFSRGEAGLNTAFVKTSSGWYPMNSLSSDVTFSMAINPTLCNSLTTIEKQDNERAISLYPNPTKTGVSVDLGQACITPLQLKIFGITGKCFSEGKMDIGEQTKYMDVTRLDAGMYFLQVIGNENVRVESFIKI